MARLLPIAIVFILIAAAIAKYKQSQTKNCSTGQCKQPASTSITSKLRSLASPPPVQPQATAKQPFQPPTPQPSAANSISSQPSTLDKTRKEAFEAGKALGKLEALKEIERREDKARQEGKESGLIEGEAKGHEEGMELGEAVGYAKAAAEEFRKGQKVGEKYGRIEGFGDAQKEMLQLIDEAEQAAEERGEKMGRIDGITEGKEMQRRENYYSIAAVAVSISSAFCSLLFFVYTRREPGSVTEYRRLEEERRKLRDEARTIDAKNRDWFFTQWEDHQRRLLTHDASESRNVPGQAFHRTERGASNGKP